MTEDKTRYIFETKALKNLPSDINKNIGQLLFIGENMFTGNFWKI